MFCDSDRYSVALSLSQIPQAQRELMMKQLDASGQALEQLEMENAGASRGDSRAALVADYVQSLYRFFKLFRRKGEFADPFALRLNIPSVPLLAPEFDDDDTLGLIAEFYFKRGYYADALDVFSRINRRQDTPQPQVLQKMGWCEEALGHLSEAVELYTQAEMLGSQMPWTLKRLARCHRLMGNWEKALDSYKALAALNPDDARIALNMGLALVKLKRYDEALQQLLKAEFYSTGNEKATRALAWCTLLAGDYDRCVRYTATLLSQAQPQPGDYMRAGHLSLLTGHPGEAVEHYRDALKGYGNDRKKFLEDLLADRDNLRAFKDLDPHIADIVTDAVLSDK